MLSHYPESVVLRRELGKAQLWLSETDAPMSEAVNSIEAARAGDAAAIPGD
jgi:hypothetical protein